MQKYVSNTHPYAFICICIYMHMDAYKYELKYAKFAEIHHDFATLPDANRDPGFATNLKMLSRT